MKRSHYMIVAMLICGVALTWGLALSSEGTREQGKELLTAKHTCNLINEGFIAQDSSFDEFIKTQSIDCVVPNNERINILKDYTEL